MISCGHKHSVAVSSEGVWAFGDDSEGQLGLGEVPGISSAAGRRTLFDIPHRIPSLTDITAVSCGEEFTVCLESNGDVWSFGSNSSAQLGLGHFKNVLTPTKIPLLSNITAVACGGFHTLCIAQDLSLWGFGRNSNGQLGLGDTRQILKPCQVPVHNTVSAFAGRLHSIIINESQQAFVSGSNFYGQCGREKDISTVVVFTLVELSNIIAASGGFRHTLFLDSDGFVYGCGDTDKLGLGAHADPKLGTIYQIPGLESIKLIGCGENHSLCVDTEGTLYCFGSGEYGQLGTGQFYSLKVPTKTSLSGVLAISMGGNHSIVKDEENQIWCFGSNGFRQLGLGIKSECVLTPTMMNDENSHIIGVYKRSSKKSARK